ncbi:MAG: T9SS type A sorting domain-containing protein [Fidelibacterota bacterium]
MKKRNTIIYIMTLILLMLICTDLEGALSESDHTNMMKHLKILNEDGWVDSSKNICNTIISRANYNWQDWHQFFENFYKINRPTKKLWNYLGYPAYYWFNNNVHYNVQRSHIDIYTHKIDSLFQRYQKFLATSMMQDSTMREALFVYVNEMAKLINKPQSLLEAELKDSVVLKIEQWINDYPKFFKKSSDTEPSKFPYVGYIRWQFAAILIDKQPLTDDRISHIIELFDISGQYADIFRNHRLYIADNLGMRAKDLTFIDTFMDLIPDTLTNHKYLSNRSYYYNDKQKSQDVYKAKGAINTFSYIGGYQENSFPDDMTPKTIDGFSVVVAHETNHRVDSDFIYRHDKWNSRRQQLLAQAGNDNMQFLRGNADYFQNAPQEFIASISNQWFTGSRHTLKHSIQRFEKGYHEPINQFLYFCDLYAVGGDTTRFYEIDTQGNIDMTKILLSRNDLGHITAVHLPDTTYTFDVDEEGNVTALDKSTTSTVMSNEIKSFYLGCNYPNPFNPATTISFSLPKKTQTRLIIYNMLGEIVATLADHQLAAGFHSLTWNAHSFASGIYFYQLTAGQYSKTRKMVLQK